MRKKIYIILTAVITVALVELGILVFSSSYVRLVESFRDFGLSCAYYFCEIFEIEHGIIPTVTIPSNNAPSVELPSDWSGFQDNAKGYFALLINKDNFLGWLNHISVSAELWAKILVILLPFALALAMLIRQMYRNENTRHNVDTKPLKVFNRFSSHIYLPTKLFLQGYIEFVKDNGWIWRCWIVAIALHFNLGTIIMEFLAYYLYFAVSLNFPTIYAQFVKLFADLKVPFQHFPWIAVLPIAWLVFDWWRKKIALSKLRHFEARNCGFINELPIVSMSCGSMGKKKTTLITDMALSQEVMFRQKALEILQKADMKFPHFPWICFEDELKACMRYRTVYNLATVKAWVNLKKNRFRAHGSEKLQLYGYDVKRYGFYFQDELKVENLFDVLSTYAQAYFVYVIESSLIVSNYSIRTDNRQIDHGNFPVWAMDFFPEGITEGRHAHILDFDALRLGKSLADESKKGSFEFGVLAITEIGKERGNTLELKEVKKSHDETNQKNDMFNAWLKMCRHSATIDNFPFIKVFTDEQRPESWGADARDLCDIIRIISSGEQRLAMPFYTLEDMLTEWAFNCFMRLYTTFRFRRGDNTLLIRVLKNVTQWLWKRNLRIYNRFGFSMLHIEKERGTMDGKAEKKKYFLMNKKIYSRRFSTDCFSDYFNELAKNTHIGLADFREYLTEKASVEELQSQNSYFVNSLYGK